MAYSVSVTGGVNVNTGRLFPPDMSIVASPLMDASVRAIRVFNEQGILLVEFEPSAAVDAPFMVAVGDYLPGETGDEIAIASRNQGEQNRSILIYNGQGQLLSTIPTPCPYAGASDTLALSTAHCQGADSLLLFYRDLKKAVILAPSTSKTKEYYLGGLPDNSTVYESAFANHLFVAGGIESVFSTIQVIDTQENISSIDVGHRENCFWVVPPIGPPSWSDSDYIKNGRFMHLRTDQSSPAYGNPDFNNNDFDYWAGGSFNNYIETTQADYASGLPGMWEPTYTHRHHQFASTPWQNEIDPATGLNKYMMLSRLNNPAIYPGGSTFNCLTYAFDLPAIDHLYTWPQRAYVRALAEKFRGPNGSPEQLIGLDACHEWEIYVPQDESIGDYNPKMIAGFYNNLLNLYNTHAKINSRFGTDFVGSSDFDAPRNSGRGSWDNYDTNNSFFNAWVEYNRQVIFRRHAQTFSECLLAGFPPEIIKTHQIPASYAVGTPISSRRITPIDWILAAGTGFGGTRYGVWYTWPLNWIQGSFSCGQTMVGIQEYNSITENQDDATNQMHYMFEHGVNFIHCMSSFPYSDVLQNAYLSLMAGNPPREGTTGGIGQVRTVLQPEGSGNKPYNIVQVGTGAQHSGLLKSVNTDGTWEGTVYVVPFHAHVDVQAITENQSFHLTTADYSTGRRSDRDLLPSQNCRS
jgi:hypothetical protein